MRFENPANGYAETCSVPFLWALLFGPFYFVLKGVWRHAVLYFVINTVLLSVATILAGGAGYLASTLAPTVIGDEGAADPARIGIIATIAIAALVLPFLFYPFIAPGIIRRHYLRQGWTELDL